MAKKRILFLNTVYSHPAIDEALAKKNTAVIAFSVEACIELNRRKVKFLHADDFFPYSDWEKLEAMAREYPEVWDKEIRKDLIYRGVPIGQIFSRELSEHFRDMLKCYNVAVRAIEQFSPDEVICSPQIPFGKWAAVDSAPMFVHLPSVLRSVCEKKGITFDFLSGVENRQVFEVIRESRFLFDTAVKGRNTLRKTFNKVKGDKKDLRVLSVILKKGMFDAVKSYGRTKGIEVIQYYPAGDVFGPSDPSDIGPAIKRIKESWTRLNDKGKFLPSLPNELTPIRESCKEDIGSYLTGTASKIMREVANLETALSDLDIDLLLCLEDFNPMGKARVAKAEAMDIPSVVVQHGIFTKKFHIQYSNPRARYNFVWGPVFADTFVQEGFPRDHVFVTGITSVDLIYSRPKSNDEVDALMRSLGIPEGTKKILWTNTPLHIAYLTKSMKRYLAEIRGVFEMMRDRKEALIVKVHMIESPAVYKAIAEDVGYDPIIVTKDLSKLIYGSDVVMINNSTVGLQALLAGKPMVLFTTMLERDFLGFVEEGVAEPAFTLEDLPGALDRVLYDKDWTGVGKKTLNRYLERFAANPDGSGMKSVVDDVLKILKKDRKE